MLMLVLALWTLKYLKFIQTIIQISNSKDLLSTDTLLTNQEVTLTVKRNVNDFIHILTLHYFLMRLRLKLRY